MIQIELLNAENFKPDSLDNYQRRQEVRRVYRKHDGIYQLEECVYLEDWDREKRRYVAKEISSNAYITYLALEKDEVVGFIGLKRDLIGDYMILDQMHVSAVCRGQGIGRKLFEKGKEEAKKAGAATDNIGLWMPIGLSVGLGLGLVMGHNSEDDNEDVTDDKR